MKPYGLHRQFRSYRSRNRYDDCQSHHHTRETLCRSDLSSRLPDGARLGLFKNTAADNVSGYVVPQESGNRTGVRRASVLDRKGRGIRIIASGEPVECNISPYTAIELESAQHHYELPEVHYTVITVAGRQMGVGGDDSWGAPVHEEYTIKADQDMTFEFTINRV